jgi:hypothetical protein
MTESENSLSEGTAPPENLTHVITKGGFKTVEGNRKLLKSKGIEATVVCPPGTNLNG